MTTMRRSLAGLGPIVGVVADALRVDRDRGVELGGDEAGARAGPQAEAQIAGSGMKSA